MPRRSPNQGALLLLAPTLIDEDAGQPRQTFADARARELAQRVRLHGLTQLLEVRLIDDGRYRLVNGARRLRAALVAGVAELPCVLTPATAAELDALAAGLATQTEPDIAQPPLIERLGPDAYRLVFGARRVLAAVRAGWTTIACLVCEQLDPLQAHRLRLVENLHRVAPHPLDEALAIKLAWLAANAEALGLREQAAAILAVEQPPSAALAQLSALLATAGFTPTRPAISQPALLAQLGLDLDAERLKKLLAILKLDGEAQARARETELTEAGLRAIARLPVADQHRLIAAIADDPWLARRARRIARRVAQQGAPLEQALAEARGVVYQGLDAPLADDVDAGGAAVADATVSTTAPATDGPNGTEDRQAQADAANALLTVAASLTDALAALQRALGGAPLATLAAPWDTITRETLALMQQELATLS